MWTPWMYSMLAPKYVVWSHLFSNGGRRTRLTPSAALTFIHLYLTSLGRSPKGEGGGRAGMMDRWGYAIIVVEWRQKYKQVPCIRVLAANSVCPYSSGQSPLPLTQNLKTHSLYRQKIPLPSRHESPIHRPARSIRGPRLSQRHPPGEEATG